jgi:hypothetical protein
LITGPQGFDEAVAFARDEAQRDHGAGARTPFYLSRSECEVASEKLDQWRIYRVHLFSSELRVFTVSPPLDRVFRRIVEDKGTV